MYAYRGPFQTVAVPSDLDAMIRKPADIPDMSERDRKIGENVSLALMVDAQNEVLRKGLDRLGVPPETMRKLRTLDSLPIESALFLARSLEDTHRLYYLQLLSLENDAQFIRTNYLRSHLNADGTPKLGPEGQPLPPPNDENTVFWQRALNEITEELGKAYDRIRQGTADLVKMRQAAKNDGDGETGAPGKPGWGTKKVIQVNETKS